MLISIRMKIAGLRCCVLILPLSLLFLAGCVAAPVQEMSDARQAIQAAKDINGSSVPGNASLSRAQQLLKDAEFALEEGAFKKARLKAQAAWKSALQAQKVAHNSE